MRYQPHRLRLAAAAMALAGSLAACSGSPAKPATPATITVHGTITLTGFLQGPSSGQCDASLRPGMSDMAPGGQVVVYDASGKVLAAGQLDEGVIAGTDCRMPFTVQGVPAGAGPYQVEVTHRGRITFTAAQAGDVELSLDASA